MIEKQDLIKWGQEASQILQDLNVNTRPEKQPPNGIHKVGEMMILTLLKGDSKDLENKIQRNPQM